MKQLEEKKIFSFDKNFSHKIFYSKPDKYKLLEEVARRNDNIINVGSNLSYSPLGFGKNSTSINIKKFNRILEFKKNEKIITIEAGATLIELLNFTLKHNLWIPQLPGYPTISIGGAVAANSHGKSCGTHGTIRKSIKSILLFHKENGWLNLSKNENEEIFDLTIGGLGLTGTIVSVTFELLELESDEFITTKKPVKSVEECQKIIMESSNKSSFVYSWHRAENIKNFGRGFLFENSNKKKFQKGLKKLVDKKIKFSPLFFPLWNKFSISLANFFFYYTNKFDSVEKKEDFLKVIFPFYGKESYFNLFGRSGFIESQLLIDGSKIDNFINEFKRLFKIYHPTITLLSLKNMSGEQKFLRFEDKKICITFDYVNNNSSLLFMSEIDKLYNKYEILPSIIKDSRLSKEVFMKTYKNLKEFKDRLYKFDRKRVYKSEVSNRLGI